MYFLSQTFLHETVDAEHARSCQTQVESKNLERVPEPNVKECCAMNLVISTSTIECLLKETNRRKKFKEILFCEADVKVQFYKDILKVK